MTPIASAGSFAGVIDGGGYTIYGFSVYLNYSTASAGLICKAGKAQLQDINMAYSAVYSAKSGQPNVGTFVGTVSGADTGFIIDNCHAIESNVYTNGFAGGMLGNVDKTITYITDCTFRGNVHLLQNSGTRYGVGGLTNFGNYGVTVYIENCSVAGKVQCDRSTGTYIQSVVGGFFSDGGRKNSRVVVVNSVNYADVISTTDSPAGGIASSIWECGSSGSTEGLILSNCINYGNVISYGGAAGGIAGTAIKSYNGNQPTFGLRAYNFANYGAITGTTAGQVVGLYGVNNATGTNCLVELKNVVLLGDAKAEANLDGAVATTAGSVLGTFQEGLLEATKSGVKYQQVILNNVYHNGSNLVYGTESTAFADYKVTNSDLLDIQSVDDAKISTIKTALNDNAIDTYSSLVEGKIHNIWTIDASEIQGASLQLGNSVAVNLYAGQRLGFEGWNDNKIAVSKAGEAKAELASLETVTIDGTEYFHYQLPVNPAEIGDTFTFTLNGNSIAYGVEAYAVRKYANGSAKLQGLLEALMAYGDAARVNKGGEAKSMAAIGKTYDANAIGTAYENLSMAPAEGGNVEGKFLAASLNLDGHINLLLQVAEDVANVKVSYTNQEGVVETTVPVAGGEAVYEGIVATALNLHYHLEALDAAGNVVGEMDWNVSRFIQNGLNSESFNDNQATLAKALALYMQSARVYTGLDVAAE